MRNAGSGGGGSVLTKNIFYVYVVYSPEVATHRDREDTMEGQRKEQVNSRFVAKDVNGMSTGWPRGAGTDR